MNPKIKELTDQLDEVKQAFESAANVIELRTLQHKCSDLFTEAEDIALNSDEDQTLFEEAFQLENNINKVLYEIIDAI